MNGQQAIRPTNPRYRARMAAGEERTKLNQSVRKAITLLRATAEDQSANVSSLARAAGLPRATALRMIQTLEQEGFLLRVPGDERVLLGPELLHLARNTDEQLLLRELSRPVISGLVTEVRETATLSVIAPDGDLDLVFQMDAPAHLRPQSWVGQRFPLHTSASGKILLATFDEERLERFLRRPLERFTPSTIVTADALREELQRIRKLGFATTRDEEEEGLSGIAAGIYGRTDELTGIITVSGPTQRLDRQRERSAVQQLFKAAAQIESALGRGRGSSPAFGSVAQAGD
jgi:DNA-binding IclR family transcriptional regulator